MADKQFWRVKVWHEASRTYTHISAYAHSVEEIQQELVDDYVDANSWVFVEAERCAYQ